LYVNRDEKMRSKQVYLEEIDSEIFDLAQNYIVKTKSRYLNEIVPAINSEDNLVAVKLTHSLKGTSGSYGFFKLHEMAVSLEKMLKQKQWEDAKSMMSDIEVYFDSVEMKAVDLD